MDAPPPEMFIMEEEAGLDKRRRNRNTQDTCPKSELDPSIWTIGSATYQPTEIVIRASINQQVKSMSINSIDSSPSETVLLAKQQTVSLKSASTISLSVSTTNSTNTASVRRDSGYSSRRRGSSRSSSKHSIPARDLPNNDDSSHNAPKPKRPTSSRVVSTSRVALSYRRSNVEDVLALHERSTKLFDTVTPTTTHPNSRRTSDEQARQNTNGCSLSRSMTAPQGAEHMISSSLPSSTLPPYRTESIHRSRARPTRSRTYTLPSIQRGTITRAQTSHGIPTVPMIPSSFLQAPSQTQLESVDQTSFVPATVMHWTSNETRRREYEAIDKQSRGLRGLWNKIRPRALRSKCGTVVGFYDPDADQDDGASDAGSVRRYRLPLDN